MMTGRRILVLLFTALSSPAAAQQGASVPARTQPRIEALEAWAQSSERPIGLRRINGWNYYDDMDSVVITARVAGLHNLEGGDAIVVMSVEYEVARWETRAGEEDRSIGAARVWLPALQVTRSSIGRASRGPDSTVTVELGSFRIRRKLEDLVRSDPDVIITRVRVKAACLGRRTDSRSVIATYELILRVIVGD